MTIDSSAKKPEKYIGPDGKVKIRMVPVKQDISTERKLSKAELKGREKIAQDLPDDEFKKRYGDDWKSVKMATATKMAKKKYESTTNEVSADLLRRYTSKANDQMSQGHKGGPRIQKGVDAAMKLKRFKGVTRADSKVRKMYGAPTSVPTKVAATSEARRGRPSNNPENDGPENMMVQLNKHISLRGQKPLEFQDGSKKRLSMQNAQGLLNHIKNMKDGQKRHEFVKNISKSPEHMKKHYAASRRGE